MVLPRHQPSAPHRRECSTSRNEHYLSHVAPEEFLVSRRSGRTHAFRIACRTRRGSEIAEVPLTGCWPCQDSESNGITAEIIYRLTEASLTSHERQRSLHDFAREAGWCPSDELVEYPGTEQFANGHLLVEHGMANTAVISFLKPDRPFTVLEKASQLRLLELSYNNLVDWHLLPDRRGLTAIYNRAEPPRDFRFDDREAWCADAFAQISGRRVKPEFKALDDAFVSTVSFWKRVIGTEVGKAATNERLSALFNVLIFVRAYEDHSRRLARVTGDRLLVNLAATEPNPRIGAICERAIQQLGTTSIPHFIQGQVHELATFDTLDADIVRALVADFYKNRFSPYGYDFSLISKHALSRIYEHYVSILRSPQGGQLQFFPAMMEELTNKNLGSYYTPQYVARFFARYLQEYTAPKDFREMKIVDPACGSGIFLRTALELRCDPLDPLARATVSESFRNVLGLDIEPSACEATKLSLSLLYLVLTDEFPDSLNIQARDAVEFVRAETGECGTFGAVVANPPYIRWESQSQAWQQRVEEYLGDLRQGKVDAYVALLKVGLDLVRPGGFAMYVLPHTFLYANNTQKLREVISRDFWIRLVADLSDIKVFEDVNSYTILLIIQRKCEVMGDPLATVVKCRSEVGEALSTALRRRAADNEFFQVFEAPQAAFTGQTWKLIPPRQRLLISQLEKLPPLSSLTRILQGVVTGADKVFLRKRADVPAKERSCWRPLLADREMIPYVVPKDVEQMVFYPVENGRRLEEGEVKNKYPDTWSHLKRHENLLRSRKSLAEGGAEWWRPQRLRESGPLFSPKIVCPHLMLTPRFAIDFKGRYAVTRAPFLVPTKEYSGGGDDLLKYVVAILNSAAGFWQVTTQSHKYSRQYAMVENKTLNDFRLPDPLSVPAAQMRRLIALVNERIEAGFSPEVESSIDKAVAELYGLEEADLQAMGLE